MKTPDIPVLLARFEAALPEPERALRLARWLIPACLVVGLVAEPLLLWLLPI